MKNTRPPIVTVLGHVDHGKTTLLDAIRKTSVAPREAGGITQNIGASVVRTKGGNRITFIDTPGHAAFAKMRQRGARVADIAILVIAADDGVAPQTKEALSYIKEAKIPFIVAITKIDLTSADPEKVRSQLEKEGVLQESRGGDVPVAMVSAKTNKGLDELLELISLVAEINEIKSSDDSSLEVVVIETSKDRRGLTVSAVVRNGNLKVGDEVVSDGITCRIRGLFNDQGLVVKEIGPGEPVLILGFSSLPPVGSVVTHLGDKLQNKEGKVEKIRTGRIEEGKLPIVLKAQNEGVLQAIVSNLPQKITLVAASIGEVIENDVFLAKAANARIFVFGGKVSTSVKKLALTEGITIEVFMVIYELFKRLEELSRVDEEIIGKAEIIKSFDYDKGKRIAGCKLLEGSITKSSNLFLIRGEKRLGEVKIISVKKGKDEAVEVKKGEEFGINFTPQFDFKPGDMLLSVAKK